MEEFYSGDQGPIDPATNPPEEPASVGADENIERGLDVSAIPVDPATEATQPTSAQELPAGNQETDPKISKNKEFAANALESVKKLYGLPMLRGVHSSLDTAGTHLKQISETGLCPEGMKQNILESLDTFKRLFKQSITENNQLTKEDQIPTQELLRTYSPAGFDAGEWSAQIRIAVGQIEITQT